MPRTLMASVLLPLGGCGGGGSVAPTPTVLSTPAPADSGRLNMTLLAQLDTGALSGRAGVRGSGNWGYTARRGGRRFALTGTSAGLSIVEVTDPGRPRNIAFIDGAPSGWREVKTYRDYVYVTTEARTGLDIIDMSNPDRPLKVQTWNKTFDSAHSLWIDEARGLLFANGTRSGMHVLDLKANPRDPSDVGSFGEFYVHESYARGTTLYASAIQNGFLAILDVSDPARIRRVTQFVTGGSFTHNAWLTDDGRYLFTTDEQPNFPVEGWDLADPLSPRRVSQFIAAPFTVPHNVMIDGSRLLVSHYSEGVHLLDIADPTRPRRIGFFDTFTTGTQFLAGCWGAYMFPRSNLILASDIQGGLFVIGYTGS